MTTRNATIRASSAHKDIATTFLQMAVEGDVQRAFKSFTGEDFRHHNAYFRGDAKALATAMAENAAQNPQKKLRVVLTLEDGDLVAVFSRMRHHPAAAEYALVHIFRFADDRIVELWDVAQEVPGDSPNENGVF